MMAEEAQTSRAEPELFSSQCTAKHYLAYLSIKLASALLFTAFVAALLGSFIASMLEPRFRA
jgi:hypothetical protein